jgi:hypothetical protein
MLKAKRWTFSSAMSKFCVEWLCTQERWNPEVAILFGAAANYRRATAGGSHDDAHLNNLTLHAGAVCSYTGFIESLFFISPRTGHGSSQVFEILPAASCISWACAFRAGDDSSILISGPVEAEERHSCPVSAGWRFWNIMAHPLFGEEDSTSPPRWLRTVARIAVQVKSSTLPIAKSQTRSKQNKDMQKCSSVYSERGMPLPVFTSGGE